MHNGYQIREDGSDLSCLHPEQHRADSGAQFVTRPTTAQPGAYPHLKFDGLTPSIADVVRLCRWECVSITHDLDASGGNGLCCRIFQSPVKAASSQVSPFTRAGINR